MVLNQETGTWVHAAIIQFFYAVYKDSFLKPKPSRITISGVRVKFDCVYDSCEK